MSNEIKMKILLLLVALTHSHAQGTCPAGQYVSAWNPARPGSGRTVRQCSSCGIGYWKYNTNDAETCTVCRGIRSTTGYGSTSSADCKCPKATHYPASWSGIESQRCIGCVRGTYKDVVGDQTTCDTCSAGTYSWHNAETCSTCDAGTSSGKGASACSPWFRGLRV